MNQVETSASEGVMPEVSLTSSGQHESQAPALSGRPLSGKPRRRPLKVGLELPIWTNDSLSWSDVLAVSDAAVDAGFDSLWVVDHLLLESTNAELRRRARAGVPEGAVQLPEGYFECFSVLAALAERYPRIELGSLVACTGYRNPALLAKIADTIDAISGGRFTLAVGAGDSEEEHRIFGYPYDHRIGRFEEALTIVSKLLREGELDFEGKYYQVHDCQLLPRGPRAKGPPIMIGTFIPGPRMQRLVAQFADVWNGALVYGVGWAESIPPLRQVIDDACRTHGREPATLRRTAMIRVVLPGGEYGAGPGERPLTGSPEVMAEELRRFAREGIEEVQCGIVPGTPAGVAAFGEVIGLLERG